MVKDHWRWSRGLWSWEAMGGRGWWVVEGHEQLEGQGGGWSSVMESTESWVADCGW